MAIKRPLPPPRTITRTTAARPAAPAARPAPRPTPRPEPTQARPPAPRPRPTTTARPGADDAHVARMREAQRRIARNATKREEELTGELEQLRRQLRDAQSAQRTDRALYKAGITDPEDIDLVKFYHQRLPAAQRPRLDQWVEQMRQAPETAPRALQPVLGAPPAGRPQGRAGMAGPVARRINPNRASAPDVDRDTRAEPTQAELDAVRAAAAQGDRRPLDAVKQRMGLPVRKGRR